MIVIYINFINFYKYKFFDKSLIKININNKSKKNEIAYSTACNLRTACLWSLNLDWHNAQQCILNVSSKGKF